MLSGQDIFAELEHRKKRYKYFTYEENQQLKNASTSQEVQSFFDKKNYSISVIENSTIVEIVDKIENEFKAREIDSAKVTFWCSLLSEPFGILLFGPLFLLYSLLRWFVSFFTPTKHQKQ